METEKIIRLSVRNLVEFILKEGDIDNRISGTLDKDAMLMGGRLHRKIQRMMGSNYQAEVSLKLQLPCDGFQLKLEGRADGILLESEKTIIDEPSWKAGRVCARFEPVVSNSCSTSCQLSMRAPFFDCDCGVEKVAVVIV